MADTTPRTITLDVDGVRVTCRVLDSSDACDNANVHLAEIQEWSLWIRRVYDRFVPMPEGRRYRMEAGALMCEPILCRYGMAPEAARAAAGEIAAKVLDRLVPGTAGDEPEQPGATTMERIARAKEYRRAALGKLVRSVAVECGREQLDELLDHCRREETMWQVIDALMSAPETPAGTGEDADADA